MSQEIVPPLPKSSSSFNGCLIGCIVVVVVGLLGAGLVGYTLYKTMQGAVTAYTEEAPRELPALNLDEQQMTAAQEKLAQFRAAVESGTGPREFSFTGDELNVMLRSSQPGQFFGDSVYVSVANSEVRGEVSFDLGTLIPILKGRYANGSATFRVYTEGGELFVYVESFQVKGEAASEELMQGMRNQNLALEASKDPEFRAWVARIDEIRAEGDVLLIRLKDGAAATPAEGVAPPEAPVLSEPVIQEEAPAPEEAATPQDVPVPSESATPPPA
jgi:hypothetical protein